jgi:hypothetical protein
MMTSVDGRIVTEGWPITADERRQYELVHATYEPEGWGCERSATRLRDPFVFNTLGARPGANPTPR